MRTVLAAIPVTNLYYVTNSGKSLLFFPRNRIVRLIPNADGNQTELNCARWIAVTSEVADPVVNSILIRSGMSSLRGIP